MYRLVLYGLFVLAGLAIIFGFTGILSYSGLSLIYSLLVIIAVCGVANYILAKLFKVQTNVESVWITSLILFLILFPIASWTDFGTFILAGVLAMGSKYILAINKKHIFNPTAISVFILGLFGFGISWWVGSSVMFIPVAVLGLLVLRKIRRFSLFFSFLLASVASIFAVGFSQGIGFYEILGSTLISGPIIFFGTIMLTEPSTTPPTRKLQIVYGLIVGGIFGLQFHFGPIYSSPELALILGNLFSYFVSPKIRSVLTLVRKDKLTADVYDYVWQPDRKVSFNAGQYLEWTLGHWPSDSRGNRRYFTIASSPTEENIHLGVKFYPNGSSFKNKLSQLNAGDTIVASQLSGDFVLPENKNQKLVFIAGGIGVTPFRSMVKYLVDANEKRDVVLFYSNRTPEDVAYKDLFDSAGQSIGFKVIYAGLIDKNMIIKEVPDYTQRKFYISGPHGMVDVFEGVLKDIGVKNSNIKVDFFPGYV